MSSLEILSLIITLICLISFCIVFTFLFRAYFKNTIKNINEGKEDIELIDQAVIDEQRKHSKKQRVLKLVGKISSYVLLGAVIAFFGAAIVSRIAGNTLFFGDTTVVVIASGSMSKKNSANTYLQTYDLNNQINTYDIIGISKYNNSNQVRLYDVVAFKADNGTTIVHRIIDIQYDDNGVAYYTTRGDSNAISDNGSLYNGYLTYENLVGHYNGARVPVLGSFIIFLQSGSGIITIISIIYCFIMFDIYKRKLDEAIINRSNMLIELINYDPSNGEIINDFKQELYYQGIKYTFKDGQFIEKSETIDERFKNVDKDDMVFVNESKNETSIKIKNTKNNHISDLNDKRDK